MIANVPPLMYMVILPSRRCSGEHVGGTCSRAAVSLRARYFDCSWTELVCPSALVT